jgi:Na+-transporting NADH:ubiquinone oxidoreductase subunit B
MTKDSQPRARQTFLSPLWEAIEGFFYRGGGVTSSAPFVRDSIDMKRMMFLVLIALIPTCFMACYGAGTLALQQLEHLAWEPQGERAEWLLRLGLRLRSDSILGSLLWGASFFLPLYLVSFGAGAFWEILFACVRRREINEGFLVTSLLFPLTLPPTLPLWQAALGISFGVVLGKEIFGGTGRNFLNPALVGRAFLTFAYPASLSGDEIWLALDPGDLERLLGIDATSGATLLSLSLSQGLIFLEESGRSWWSCFWGPTLGSFGETSRAASLLGAFLLIASGLASWQIMLGILLGVMITASCLFWGLDPTPSLRLLPPHWHLVLGGLFFGTVFMATDPVTAALSRKGRWIYGFLIGSLVILIRAFHPVFPEGVMLSILFGNACAPLIDSIVLWQAHKRRLRQGGLG